MITMYSHTIFIIIIVFFCLCGVDGGSGECWAFFDAFGMLRVVAHQRFFSFSFCALTPTLFLGIWASLIAMFVSLSNANYTSKAFRAGVLRCIRDWIPELRVIHALRYWLSYHISSTKSSLFWPLSRFPAIYASHFMSLFQSVSRKEERELLPRGFSI